jgi:hypothetical protein
VAAREGVVDEGAAEETGAPENEQLHGDSLPEPPGRGTRG